MTNIISQNSLFVRGDPISKFLIGRFKLNIVMAALIFYLIYTVPLFVVAANANVLNSGIMNGKPFIGLLQDYSIIILLVTAVPASILYFLWMPKGILDTIQQLIENKVIRISDSNKNKFESFLAKFDYIFSHWAWITICMLAMAIYVIYVLNPSIPSNSWNSEVIGGKSVFWYHAFHSFITFSIVALMVVRLIISIYWFNRLFKEFDVKVRVLHPDKAGGLSPLGAFSVKIGYLIGVYGIAVFAITFRDALILTRDFSTITWSPVSFFAIFIYIFLAPLAFFAPISTAHSAMKTAKNKFLLEIADQYESDTYNVESKLDEDADELEKSLKKIEQLKKIHNLASDFPIWPFNSRNLIRFFSLSVLTDFVGFIILDIYPNR